MTAVINNFMMQFQNDAWEKNFPRNSDSPTPPKLCDCDILEDWKIFLPPKNAPALTGGYIVTILELCGFIFFFFLGGSR